MYCMAFLWPNLTVWPCSNKHHIRHTKKFWNWGKLGILPQTEERYFTVHYKVFNVHCSVYTFLTQLVHPIFNQFVHPIFLPNLSSKLFHTIVLIYFYTKLVHLIFPPSLSTHPHFFNTIFPPNSHPFCPSNLATQFFSSIFLYQILSPN